MSITAAVIVYCGGLLAVLLWARHESRRLVRELESDEPERGDTE